MLPYAAQFLRLHHRQNCPVLGNLRLPSCRSDAEPLCNCALYSSTPITFGSTSGSTVQHLGTCVGQSANQTLEVEERLSALMKPPPASWLAAQSSAQDPAQVGLQVKAPRSLTEYCMLLHTVQQVQMSLPQRL